MISSTATLLLWPGALLTFFQFSLFPPPSYPVTAWWNITSLLIPITAVSLSHYSDRYREASAASCFQFFFPFSFFLNFFYPPFFFKFDFGFEAGAQLRSWRESACQGKSRLHGEKLPRDHSTFAASWLRDETGQNKETDSGKTHSYIMKLMINSDD